jgi:hypothetical protein
MLLDSDAAIPESVCREIPLARASTHTLIPLTKKKWQCLQKQHGRWRRKNRRVKRCK